MPGIPGYDHGTLRNHFLGQALEELGVSYEEVDSVAHHQKALEVLDARARGEYRRRTPGDS